MKRSEIFLKLLVCAAAFAATWAATAMIGTLPASAQSFQTYRCVDGTEFIVGFYPYDSRAYMQIDGRAVILLRRLTLSGSRYSGAGVTLKMTPAGATTIKHAKRRAVACESY